MDDLTANLNRILSDPQSMAQIQSMMQSMGIGSPDAGSSPETPQTGGTQSASGSSSGGFQTGNSPSGSTPGGSSQNSYTGGISPAGLTAALAPFMGAMGQEDDSTRLLSALRPLLSPGRQKKIDEAVKILRMIRMLPLLKNSGLLDSIFGI